MKSYALTFDSLGNFIALPFCHLNIKHSNTLPFTIHSKVNIEAISLQKTYKTYQTFESMNI